MRKCVMIAICIATLLLPACNDMTSSAPPEDYVGPVTAAEISVDDSEPETAILPQSKDSKRTVSVQPKKTGPLRISLAEAVLTALASNASFRVDRLQPSIERTYEEQERAAFDPSLSANLSRTRERKDEDLHKQIADETTNDKSAVGGVTLKEFLPTGTTLELGADRAVSFSNKPTSETRSRSTGVDIAVTQSLLRGLGPAVNLARLRQARIDTRISQYELRAAAENLVAQVENAYWDYILYERAIEIYTKSLEIAKQQIAEVKERIRIGKVAESELAAAEAEVAGRREELINARSRLATTRLELLLLLGTAGSDGWSRKFTLTEKPGELQLKLDDVEAHVKLSLRKRPDLNQSRLQVKLGDLEIVRTRNGLLPKLDLFVRFGGTRYADCFSTSNDKNGDKREVKAGVELEYALGHRRERATHRRAMLTRERAREALTNMEQLVQVDVRSAYVEVTRVTEQIAATRATRKLREETLRSEQEKFRVGRSTTLLVSQAWRDLVTSQIAEIEAIIGYRKALLQLYRLEGTLLERRGIKAPAAGPVN